MKRIAKRDYQRSDMPEMLVPEALVLEDRSGVSGIVFPITPEILEEFGDAFLRLEAGIQFAFLARRASKNAPPLSEEEILEEIRAHRKGQRSS